MIIASPPLKPSGSNLFKIICTGPDGLGVGVGAGAGAGVGVGVGAGIGAGVGVGVGDGVGIEVSRKPEAHSGHLDTLCHLDHYYGLPLEYDLSHVVL